MVHTPWSARCPPREASAFRTPRCPPADGFRTAKFFSRDDDYYACNPRVVNRRALRSLERVEQTVDASFCEHHGGGVVRGAQRVEESVAGTGIEKGRDVAVCAC